MVQWSVFSAVLLFSVISFSVAERKNGPLTFFYRGLLFDGNLEETDFQSRTISEEYIEQPLDHFKPADTRMWKQRFFANGEYFKKGGPAFLMIGGEGTASKAWMYQGEWIETAKEFHALCFQLEHRYYGKSQPKENVDTENLAFLSSQQALADLAFFIQMMNQKYKLPLGTKWIVFGGSYAGNLAAWMRLQYPHLVYAAVSSSAPLRAKLDFVEYYETVRDVIKKNSSTCLEAIADGIKRIEGLLLKISGQRQVEKMLRLCEPMKVNNKTDMAYFFEILASRFATTVQYNDHARINLAKVCSIMVDKSIGTPFQRLAQVNSIMLTSQGSPCVNQNYEGFMEYLGESTLSSYAVKQGARQWTWQTCTEFGYFQTSAAKAVPELYGSHGIPLDFFVKQCQRLFGERFDEKFLQKAVERSNRIFGDVQLNSSRVIHVHGSMDPWHPLGMLKTMHAEAPAIFIEGTSHCADTKAKAAGDPENLNKARNTVRSYLRRWLQENTSQPSSFTESHRAKVSGSAISSLSHPVLYFSVTALIFLCTMTSVHI